MSSSPPLPASVTKHLDELNHALPGKRGEGCVLTLRQASRGDTHAESSSTLTGNPKEAGSTGTTGTTLWLGAQIMAVYLDSTLQTSSYSTDPGVTSSSSANLNTASAPSTQSRKRPRALELGSGIGYLALYLASKGYDVVATDIEPSLSSVLAPNITHGIEVIEGYQARATGKVDGVGKVDVKAIDWMDSPDIPRPSRSTTVEHSSGSVLPASSHTDPAQEQALAYLESLVDDGLDMIITTDTLYAPPIVLPLWRTIYHLSHLAARISPRSAHPQVLIALENRDPGLIASALAIGAEMGFEMRRVPQSKLSKGLKEAGWGWGREEWEGVEVWKGSFKDRAKGK